MSNSLIFFSVHNRFGRSKSLLTFILFCQQNKWILDNTFCTRSPILRNTIYDSNNSVKLISFKTGKHNKTQLVFVSDWPSSDISWCALCVSKLVRSRRKAEVMHADSRNLFQSQTKNINQIKSNQIQNSSK